MAVIPWTEIVGFANIRKFMLAYPDNLNGNPVVTYRSKVKLHGSNCAVQIHMDGSVICQSRTSILTPEDDYAGFAKWVKSNEDAWRKTVAVHSMFTGDEKPDHYLNVIFYGEWIGPGVQKGVAVSEIPKKSFAIFAMRFLDKDGLPLEDNLIIEPARIEMYNVQNIPDTYVLPWYSDPLEIGWTASDEVLEVEAALINQWVSSIEANDPWVEDNFGVKGTGEGLVFYPVSKEHLGATNFNNLVFKAKGEKHRVVKAKAAVQVSADVAANADQFVAMVLTEARLEQGARAIQGEHKHEEKLDCLWCITPDIKFELKRVGEFIKWITADVQKETKDEMEAAGLTWEQVNKPLTTFARTWYLGKSK